MSTLYIGTVHVVEANASRASRARSRVSRARRRRLPQRGVARISELSARGRFLVASRLSNRARHAGVADALPERLDSLLIAALELGSFVRVEVDEIDFARHVARDLRETIRVLVAVVDALEHDVLEKHLPLVSPELDPGEFALKQPEQRLQIIFTIDGHDPVANVIRRRVAVSYTHLTLPTILLV